MPRPPQPFDSSEYGKDKVYDVIIEKNGRKMKVLTVTVSDYNFYKYILQVIYYVIYIESSTLARDLIIIIIIVIMQQKLIHRSDYPVIDSSQSKKGVLVRSISKT
jgi:hypothetical protein